MFVSRVSAFCDVLLLTGSSSPSAFANASRFFRVQVRGAVGYQVKDSLIRWQQFRPLPLELPTVKDMLVRIAQGCVRSFTHTRHLPDAFIFLTGVRRVSSTFSTPRACIAS